MNQKKLKLAVLVFALTFVMGTAFAATNGMLAFGGTVRINSVNTSETARLEFMSASILCSFGNATSAIVVGEGGIQHLTYETVIDFCPTFDWPDVMSQVDFSIRNTGSVPVRFESNLLGNFTHHVEVYIHGIVDDEAVLFYSLVSSPNSPISTYASGEFIQPGQVLEGYLLFNPLNVNLGIPDDFDELIRRNSFSLAYTTVPR